MNTPRPIIDGIITDENEKILVIDKIKNDNRVLTILPGGKLEEGESDFDCLIREIKEEIGINLILSDIGLLLGVAEGKSPSSKIISEIKLYQIQTQICIDQIILETGLKNPRYLSCAEILKLNTTTDLTKKSIVELFQFKQRIFQNTHNEFRFEYGRIDNEVVIIYNEQIYLLPIQLIKLKKISYHGKDETLVCFIENLEYIHGSGDNKQTAYSNFIGKLLSHIDENGIQATDFNEMLIY